MEIKITKTRLESGAIKIENWLTRLEAFPLSNNRKSAKIAANFDFLTQSEINHLLKKVRKENLYILQIIYLLTKYDTVLLYLDQKVIRFYKTDKMDDIKLLLFK